MGDAHPSTLGAEKATGNPREREEYGGTRFLIEAGFPRTLSGKNFYMANGVLRGDAKMVGRPMAAVILPRQVVEVMKPRRDSPMFIYASPFTAVVAAGVHAGSNIHSRKSRWV